MPKSCVFSYLLHFIFAVNNCMPMYSKSFARIITPDCQHSEEIVVYQSAITVIIT